MAAEWFIFVYKTLFFSVNVCDCVDFFSKVLRCAFVLSLYLFSKMLFCTQLNDTEQAAIENIHTIDERRSKIVRKSVLKTLFLEIFDLLSLIVKSVFNCCLTSMWMGDFILKEMIKLGLTFEKLFDFFGSPIGCELVYNIQRSLIIGISFIYIHTTLKL